jgi:hypothetical protein
VDKVLHFIAGFLISAAVTVYFTNPLAGFVTASVVGALKELADHALGAGTPEWDDFWWTSLGGFWGMTAVLGLAFVAWLVLP